MNISITRSSARIKSYETVICKFIEECPKKVSDRQPSTESFHVNDKIIFFACLYKLNSWWNIASRIAGDLTNGGMLSFIKSM